MYHDPEALRQIIEGVVGFPDGHNTAGDVDYRCPFCERAGYDLQSHLHVNYRKGVALCHQCGWKTKDLLYLIRALTGSVPRSLLQAQMGVELVDFVRDMFQRAKKAEPAGASAVKLPEEFIPLTERPKDPTGRAVLRYLVETRAVTMEMIREVGVGYARTGRFNGYAIFPVYVCGELVTYTSRRVIGTSAKAQHAPNSKSGLAIFNYDVAAKMRARRVFVGEGPFDAWAFHRRADPRDAGCGLLGKVLHDDQARLLGQLDCEELCMCLDDTEHLRTQRYAVRLSKMTNKRISYILLREGSGDPHENRERLPRYIERRQYYDGGVDAVLMELG